MRIGQNPAKFVKEVAKPARITVAVLNYIPFLSGFYADMLKVLQTCLDSIVQTADMPYDLLVFDNASCPEVRQYLADEYEAGRIQYLVLSDKNLGIGGAWNMTLAGAPGEIITYTDNDCLFSPGWLSRSVQLLETYPNVGMVTARPFRTRPEVYSATRQWAEAQPEAQVETGKLVPWETIRDFDLSLGQDEDDIRQRFESGEDVCLTYRGVKAFAGASHWQFTAYKSVLEQFLPFQMDRPMGQVKQLDERINAAGLLRLMVSDPLAMNMSNTLPGTGKESSAGKAQSKPLLDFPPVKRILLGIYDAIFRAYYDR